MFRNVILFFISLAIPLLAGFGSSQFSLNSAEVYGNLVKPPLAPPGYIFGIVWTIIYIMMGISTFLVLMGRVENNIKIKAISKYLLQLFINFFWTFFFFYLDYKFFAFIWILILLLSLIWCMKSFQKISKFAFYLLLPYFFWTIFATYLNLSLFILN